jgi:hypothetical protein
MIDDMGRGTFMGDAVLSWCEDDDREEDPRRMTALGSFFPEFQPIDNTIKVSW